MLAEIDALTVISRWFHLAAVIVAVGGTFFLRIVLHPVAEASLAEDARQALRDNLVRRWARVVHVAILFIVLSGTYNLIVQLPQHKAAAGSMLYHALLGPKILLALVLFFIAIAITGRSRTFESMRKQRPKWLAVNIAIAAVIVLISNILRNIPVSPPAP